VNPPCVSVLMPAYNGASFIDAALESLQRQTFTDLEIIVVVDSRSVDGTRARVVDRALRDARLLLIDLTERHGLFRALNTALKNATGRYIAFLDSDDLCPPGRIARQVEKLDTDPTVGAIVGEVLLFEKLGPDLQPMPGTRWARVLSPALGAGTFRRAALQAIGEFDESFSHSADVDFLLRLHDSDWPIRPEPELGLLCRKHNRNMSADPDDVQRFLLRALQRSIKRRRESGRLHAALPFALMKPLSEIKESENGFPGHRTKDLFLRGKTR
jgi:glycosyltransferase involved in cell wall biosynthesis